MSELTIEVVEAILPQMQCGECTYSGCKPYASAILQGDRIDRCTPGGTETLIRLASILKRDPYPLVETMKQKTKPLKMAFIQEEDCIGCTKCIQACPVDAIIGTSKMTHTVLEDECTGCGLCFDPCPTNCIVENTKKLPTYQKSKAQIRYQNKMNRKMQVQTNPDLMEISNNNLEILSEKKRYLEKLKLQISKKNQT